MKLPDWLVRLRAGSMGVEDAECGVFNSDECVQTLLGPEPRRFDPVANDEDRRVQHRRLNTTLRNEMDEDQRAREAARAAEMSPFLAVPLVLALFLVEVWASARVLVGLAIEAVASLVLGSALALGLFALAGYCVAKPARKFVYVLAVAGFSIFIIALTVLRMQEVTSDDSNATTDLASAIVLVVLSLGPAFIGEVVLRKATAALRVRRDLRTVKRQLRAEDREIERANDLVTRRNDTHETWTRQSAIARAEYRRVWDVTVRRRAMEDAKLPAPAPGTTPSGSTAPATPSTTPAPVSAAPAAPSSTAPSGSTALAAPSTTTT
jgi:hypothetical protein